MSTAEVAQAPDPGWRTSRSQPSLPEIHGSILVPEGASRWRKMLAFIGPGGMVAVGYMDPGNWATDIAGGSQFGYALLSVILLSNLMAILLQALSLRLGIATGRDLAQACRDHYSRPVSFALWFLCELAIAACDLAELLGSAIALNLLFGIPMVAGVCITALDVLLLLMLQQRGFRYLEAIVLSLVGVIGACFAVTLFLAQPAWGEVAGSLLPRREILQNPEMLLIAVGILGATVMPHNLYLHSSIVQTRQIGSTTEERRSAIRYATADSTVSLLLAFLINASILILAAATFHRNGMTQVADIHDAHKLLSPLLGMEIAGVLFAVALLASGQNSTITGTMAGQIVMEGFLNIRLKPWVRRLLTRAVAVVPAIVVASLYGDSGTAKLLVFSQVVLSLQLPFAVIPLVSFVSDRKKMGDLVISRWVAALAWVVAGVILALNFWMLAKTFA